MSNTAIFIALATGVLVWFVVASRLTAKPWQGDTEGDVGALKVEAAKGSAGEGPAWDPMLGVLTSGRDGIHRLDRKGLSSVHRKDAGTNGLLFDREGRLVCCEPVQRRVSHIDRDGKLTVLTDRFDGKRYNQPNDLTIDSKGRIYFSDPRYGSREGMEIRDEVEVLASQALKPDVLLDGAVVVAEVGQSARLDAG